MTQQEALDALLEACTHLVQHGHILDHTPEAKRLVEAAEVLGAFRDKKREN
jgi:hypothetical protein